MSFGGQQPAPQVKQETTTKMGPEQEAIFKLAFPSAQQYAQTPPQMFSGSGIAGFTPYEQQAQQKYTTGAAPVAGDLAGKAAGAQALMLDPNFMLDLQNNQYFQGQKNAITGTVTDNLMERVLPGIRANAISGGGMYSGGATSQGVAEGLAIGETNENLSRSLADLSYKTYMGGLGHMGEAIRANPSVQAQQLFEGDILASVGGQQRAMDQARLDEQIRNFYTGQSLPLLRAQELMGLISGMPGGSAISTATGALPKVNPGMNMLGGAASGASMGSMFGPLGSVGGAGIGALLAYLMNK